MSVVDLGHGYTAKPERHGDELRGFMVTGDAAPACDSPWEGRCGGFVPVTAYGSRPVWKLVQEAPLTLEPSIRCGCGGQHLFVRNGRAELCSDDVAGDPR